jgi:hypothetical protein
MHEEMKQKMIQALIDDRFECACDNPKEWEFLIKLGLRYDIEKWTDDEIAKEYSFIQLDND